jgi:hypothetical protein
MRRDDLRRVATLTNVCPENRQENIVSVRDEPSELQFCSRPNLTLSAFVQLGRAV